MAEILFCPNCGTQVNPNLRFCPQCGTAQPGAVPPGTAEQQPQFPQQAVTAAVPPFVPAGEVRVEIGRWIGEGWNVVTSDLAIFAAITLIYAVLFTAIPVVLHGPLMAGFYIACIRKMRTGIVEVGDLFKGFNWFVPALITFVLASFFTFIGFLLCIIPGIVVAAVYMFPYLFIVDRGMDFWPAMQSSHEIVKRNYFGFVMFVIACALFNLLGAIALGVGLLITVPVTFVAVAAAYRDNVGFNPDAKY